MNRFIKIFRNFRRRRISNNSFEKLYIHGTLLNSFRIKRMIFFHIPKTAGVSIIKSIFGNVTLESHRRVWFYKNIFGDLYNDYYKFTVVRNPWDRLHSAYEFLKKGGLNDNDRRSYENYLSKYNDFEDFVINGLDKNIINKIVHFIPQYEFICDDSGDINLDYILRFENLDDDIKCLSSIIKEEIKLGHHNFNPKIKYTDVYNNKMAKKVSEIYHEDIIRFGYKF